ncbi:lysosomal thioesterase PPT2 [Oryzias melastigma]|uniref:lysosomal thioesterase PPT2 n=1 Tax=Oryzias melastigma TaxID=30732 RepID=UPI000CF8050F|nr:lysosomal thioesterase PPT2 [Oryzias melastigma]
MERQRRNLRLASLCMSMKTLSSILTSPALMLLLAGGCTSAYKHVLIVHGILSGPETLQQTLSRFIQMAHPGTKVTVIDLFNDRDSTKPLWLQVQGFGKVIQRITRKSPEGVHLLCFSQGGPICRGVLSVLPNHNVHTFIALSSPLAGQYGAPKYYKYIPSPARGSVHLFCYNRIAQNQVSVCNYWNDPHQQFRYLKHNNYLPLLNGEKVHSRTAVWRNNFLRIRKLVLIGGPDDEIITPWQSSQFGFYNSQEAIIDMRQQTFYTQDSFGLKTLDARGDIIECIQSGVKHSEWQSNLRVFNRCIRKWLD